METVLKQVFFLAADAVAAAGLVWSIVLKGFLPTCICCFVIYRKRSSMQSLSKLIALGLSAFLSLSLSTTLFVSAMVPGMWC